MDHVTEPDLDPKAGNGAPGEPTGWTMPEWMEPYRHLIVNTGGNEIEDLINDLNTDTRMMRTNVIRFSLAMAVSSQVALLGGLHRAGLLKDA